MGTVLNIKFLNSQKKLLKFYQNQNQYLQTLFQLIDQQIKYYLLKENKNIAFTFKPCIENNLSKFAIVFFSKLKKLKFTSRVLDFNPSGFST